MAIICTGLLFQIRGEQPTDEVWNRVKEEAIKHIKEHGGFPASFEMPCEESFVFLTLGEIMDLPIKDVPCPCGDKTHWSIRFSGVKNSP